MSLQKTTIWTLITLVSLIAVLSYPAYRQIRFWRAGAMATEAEALLTLTTPEAVSRAWELARAASSLSPDDPDIARIVARIYTTVDPASAYPFWERVVELSAVVSEDRLELARAYLHANRWQDFDQEIATQRKAGLHPMQIDYLQAFAAMLQGDFEQALSVATTLVAKRGAPHEADVLFFQLSQISPDSAVRQAGVDHLRTIALSKGLRQEEALKTLASLPLEAADVEQLIDVIVNREDNSRDLLLLAEKLRLRLPEADPKVIYQRASALFALDEPTERVIFGRWLNSQGLQHYTRLAVSVELAMQRQDLFLILLDAMALNEEWEAIRSLLDGLRVPLEDYVREFFRMRTFIEMSDERRARLAWERALVSAGKESSKLYYLAKKANQLNLPEFEIVALQRLVESPEMRQRAMRDLLAVLQKEGRTEALHASFIKFNEYFPEHLESKSDALYLSFLMRKEAPDALAQAQALHQSQPNMLAYRMTLALGLICNDRSSDALSLLVELPVNWFEVRDRWRLITALILYKEGLNADAKTLVAGINRANLLPEEEQLLEEILEDR